MASVGAAGAFGVMVHVTRPDTADAVAWPLCAAGSTAMVELLLVLPSLLCPANAWHHHCAALATHHPSIQPGGQPCLLVIIK